MIDKGRRIVTGVVVLANATAAVYVGGMLWLLSVLHLDDGVALQMTSADWWLGGAIRLSLSAGVATVVGLTSYLLSKSASWLCDGLPGLAARNVAVITAGVAFGGGTIGAIQFVVTRPYF